MRVSEIPSLSRSSLCSTESWILSSVIHFKVLSWTPPTDTICVTFYTITLTNITEGNASYTYNTTTNTTSKTVSDLTQGAEYSFTVAGVDTGSRIGEESVSAKAIKLDSEFNACENWWYIYAINISSTPYSCRLTVVITSFSKEKFTIKLRIFRYKYRIL